MRSQPEKAVIFKALHEGQEAFIIPNPYDLGTAKLLAHLGFKALATTSAGFAFTIGRRDYTVTRDQVLKHSAEIVAATDLPVSADLEGGFGDSPETVADTIRLASEAGLVGGSIEDSTRDADNPIYELELAVERIQAAAQVVNALPFPFMLTARCENYLVGRADLKNTIERLQAYQQAGARVLYAPGLRTKEDIAAVVSSVDLPVNVLMSLQGVHIKLAELSELGVKRVSIGSGLTRAAVSGVIKAAREMLDSGTFSWAEEAVTLGEVSAIMDE
ncbi:MAG TPA: isocitrate lyase/phosphoenolpyruvate mutase family protein [Pyrinomonadaceae bacterium]|nr:isocitrate lyase/phosphoenolpyruvate mutase family protein [Pyrinomonadaceae bacterium]